MAQQKGILPLRGTIGNITFYKSKDGYLAREKGGIKVLIIVVFRTPDFYRNNLLNCLPKGQISELAN